MTISGFLIDLDGTVYTADGPIAGAVDAIARLRTDGIPYRFVTNTTRISRNGIVDRLAGYGIEAGEDEIFTSSVAGARTLRERGITRIAPFLSPLVQEDFAEFEVSREPEAVVIGDLGDAWDFRTLNTAFQYLMQGAEFLALQRNRYWEAAFGLELDAGPFVAALEYATGRDATVCGKPSPEFFMAGVASLGLEAGQVAMVGDDLWSDVEGAQGAGMEGWLVKTGKYREEALAASGVTPDRVLESISDLPPTDQ